MLETGLGIHRKELLLSESARWGVSSCDYMNMQETDSQEFLTPAAFLHILPNGQLAYTPLPSSFPPHSLSFPPNTDRTHISQQREKWGKVVLVTGLIMLLLAWVGLAGHVLMLKKTIHRGKWAVWGIGVGMCGIMVVLGVLAIRAGVKKTSSAVLVYIRILVLLTILFIVALMLSSMLRLKAEKHKWKHYSDSSVISLSKSPSQAIIPALSLSKDSKDTDDNGKSVTRKVAREAYMLGTFLLVLGTMGLFAACVLCAVKLLTATRLWERLLAEEQGHLFSYMPMQPVQAVSHRRYPQVN